VFCLICRISHLCDDRISQNETTARSQNVENSTRNIRPNMRCFAPCPDRRNILCHAFRSLARAFWRIFAHLYNRIPLKHLNQVCVIMTPTCGRVTTKGDVPFLDDSWMPFSSGRKITNTAFFWVEKKKHGIYLSSNSMPRGRNCGRLILPSMLLPHCACEFMIPGKRLTSAGGRNCGNCCCW
jgi:hypothetical protein